MADPYTAVAVSGYNSNPPPDDGSQVPANLVSWATEKTKLTDPLKTAFDTSETATQTAFGKVWGGGGVTSVSTTYQILSSDQGKLVRCTAALTATTPDATSVGAPFVCAVLNNSSGAVVIDGSGSQTVDGATTITLGSGQGCFLVTDGTNWFTCGLGAIPAGNQIGYGEIINGTIAESNATNAVTFSVKTLAGNTPSASDPVIVSFRNSTAATGNYVYRAITAACSITIPSTATMGAANGIPFRIWLGLLDNAGTPELFVINCLNASIYPLGQFPIITTTSIGTGSDLGHIPYSNPGRSSSSYLVLGYATYESGLVAAGTWNVSPTRLHLQGKGDPLPGQVVQRQNNFTGAYTATGAGNAIPNDDTIPQVSEGVQIMTQAITPTSAANILEIEWQARVAGIAAAAVTTALFQDGGPNALTASSCASVGATSMTLLTGQWNMIAATSAATTMSIRIGDVTANTIYFNGTSGGRTLGGVSNSYLRVIEVMA